MDRAVDGSEYTLLMDRGREILIVEDEGAIAWTMASFLRSKRYVVQIAHAAGRALEILSSSTIYVMVVDKRLPDMSGTDLLRRCQEISPDTVSIMVTGHGSIESAVEALHAGAFDYLEKPYSLDILAYKVEQALEKSHLAYENRILVEHLRETNMELNEALRSMEQQPARAGQSAQVTRDFLLGQAESILQATEDVSNALAGAPLVAAVAARPIEQLYEVAREILSSAGAQVEPSLFEEPLGNKKVS